MDLSRKERWILSNQYKLLEQLDQKDSDFIKNAKKFCFGYHCHGD